VRGRSRAAGDRPQLPVGAAPMAAPAAQGGSWEDLRQFVAHPVELVRVVAHHRHRVHERVHGANSEGKHHALEEALRLNRTVVVPAIKGWLRVSVRRRAH